MAFRGFQVSKEKWLEEVHALAKTTDIYMRFWFVHGHILARPSKLQVDGRTLHLHQPPLEPSGSYPIELLINLPDGLDAIYEKRTNERGGICLSIIYRLKDRDGFLYSQERLHLSNEEGFLDPVNSESLLQ